MGRARRTLDQYPARGPDIFRLVAIKTDASYSGLKFCGGRLGKIGGRAILFKKIGRDNIDLAIRALGRKHGRDKQFERIEIHQFAMGIRICRLESGDDPQNALLSALKCFASHIRLLRIDATKSAARNIGRRAKRAADHFEKSSVRNGDAGSPALFHRLTTG